MIIIRLSASAQIYTDQHFTKINPVLILNPKEQ
jgi:hypothetical protein